jgi:hypothetical protein
MLTILTRNEIEHRHNLAAKRADAQESMRVWREQVRGINLSSDSDFLAQLADALRPLYDYLANAQNPRSMGMRAWCLLYAVRPELIDFQTIQAGADYFGVTQEAVCYQLKQLEAAFPGFKYVRRPAPTNEVLNGRMLKMTRGRVERFQARVREEVP